MKEAAGEASITGITIGLIALISVIAVPVVTGIINTTGARTCCASMGGTYTNGSCTVGTTTTTGNAEIRSLCNSVE